MKIITKTELFQHQQQACDKLYGFTVGALFMEMGTGKTRTALELIKRKQNKINKVVWFCPVSLKIPTKKEFMKHLNIKEENIYIFDNKTNEKTIPKAQFYIVGIESMQSSNRNIFAAKSLICLKTFVVVDESSYIKNHRAKRTINITKLSKISRNRLILTGTPITKNIPDLYSQFYFLSKHILQYNSFYSFANNHIQYHEKIKGMIVRTLNTGYICDRINKYTYQVTKKECLNLPEKIFSEYRYNMTVKQRTIYEEIKEKFLLQIELDEFNSYSIFQMFTELQKCLSGYFSDHKRIDCLLEILDNCHSEKIIIWCKYIKDIEQVESKLENCSIYTGKLSEKEKFNQIELFRNKNKYFLATPSSGGHGLTLNEADTVIFYTNSFNYANRKQAEDRCHRIGQKNNVNYIDIICNSSIDEKIQESMSKKTDIIESFKSKFNAIKNKKNLKKEELKKLIKEL